jgi:putative hemolysin
MIWFATFFRLDERQVGSLMIPRADIEYLDINQPLEANLLCIAQSDHSRFRFAGVA